MNEADFARVRLVAQAVLDGLGHQAPPWTVLRVGWAADDEWEHLVLPPGLDAPAAHSHLLVELGTEGRTAAGESVGAHYPLHVPEAEAVAELASQIQDHAVEAESSWGRALPPCPGHAHPLSARVFDGVAVWQCPVSPAHYRQPVVPFAAQELSGRSRPDSP